MRNLTSTKLNALLTKKFYFSHDLYWRINHFDTISYHLVPRRLYIGMGVNHQHEIRYYLEHAALNLSCFRAITYKENDTGVQRHKEFYNLNEDGPIPGLTPYQPADIWRQPSLRAWNSYRDGIAWKAYFDHANVPNKNYYGNIPGYWEWGYRDYNFKNYVDNYDSLSYYNIILKQHGHDLNNLNNWSFSYTGRHTTNIRYYYDRPLYNGNLAIFFHPWDTSGGPGLYKLSIQYHKDPVIIEI